MTLFPEPVAGIFFFVKATQFIPCFSVQWIRTFCDSKLFSLLIQLCALAKHEGGTVGKGDVPYFCALNRDEQHLKTL